jgi:hypothetical protein
LRFEPTRGGVARADGLANAGIVLVSGLSGAPSFEPSSWWSWGIQVLFVLLLFMLVPEMGAHLLAPTASRCPSWRATGKTGLAGHSVTSPPSAEQCSIYIFERDLSRTRLLAAFRAHVREIRKRRKRFLLLGHFSIPCIEKADGL